MDRGKQERIHLGINERRRPAMFNDGDRIGEQVDGVSGQMAACDPYCSDFADNVSPVCLNAGLIQGRGGLSAGQKHSAGNVQARIHRRWHKPGWRSWLRCVETPAAPAADSRMASLSYRLSCRFEKLVDIRCVHERTPSAV
jgi:hypothetical protein